MGAEDFSEENGRRFARGAVARMTRELHAHEGHEGPPCEECYARARVALTAMQRWAGDGAKREVG